MSEKQVFLFQSQEREKERNSAVRRLLPQQVEVKLMLPLILEFILKKPDTCFDMYKDNTSLKVVSINAQNRGKVMDFLFGEYFSLSILCEKTWQRCPATL